MYRQSRTSKSIRNRKAGVPRGLILIKNLPHGFFEEQLEKYFGQFGRVTRVRLCRSKTTGASKGYAYVEFEIPEVAKVAAETMNNYLMFNKLVKSIYIPPEQQDRNYFKSSVRFVTSLSGKNLWVSSRTSSAHKGMKAHNRWGEMAVLRRNRRQANKMARFQAQMGAMGIEVPNVVASRPPLTGEGGDQIKANEAKS